MKQLFIKINQFIFNNLFYFDGLPYLREKSELVRVSFKTSNEEVYVLAFSMYDAKQSKAINIDINTFTKATVREKERIGSFNNWHALKNTNITI